MRAAQILCPLGTLRREQSAIGVNLALELVE